MSAIRLRILGKSPAWQDAGGACSSYLIEDSGTAVVVDCGNGAFAKLRRYRDYSSVDAVVISHLHADHFLDLVPYAYALSLSPRRERIGSRRPRLIVPPRAREAFRRVVGAWGNEELIESAFDLEEYAESSTPSVGSLRFAFREVPHFQQAFAISVESEDGPGRLVFGADCGPTNALAELARDADLLLIEATLQHPEEQGPRGHLTAAEAGEHGRVAGARRLVLTHISDELDLAQARAAAEATFAGRVDVAREGAVYEI